jgi:gamma-glutamylcyclotransferase (GGCT)/AIG2-like uncharacterized protein YtfP
MDNMNASNCLIFVYGSLLLGMGNHGLLDNQDSELVDTFETPPEFTLLDLGWYPGVVMVGDTSVKGELYRVSQAVWRDVEQLEGYPQFYDRTVLDTPHGPAVMYVLGEDYLSNYESVSSGDWKSYFLHRNCA